MFACEKGFYVCFPILAPSILNLTVIFEKVKLIVTFLKVLIRYTVILFFSLGLANISADASENKIDKNVTI